MQPDRCDPPRSRARPLPRGERRAALIAATLPLVAAHGRAVTTKAIATASGVAEGTIFRVFADKDALIDEVIAAALDPQPVIADLDRIDRGADLETRLLAATRLLQARLRQVFGLLSAVGLHRPPDSSPADRAAPLHRALVRLVAPDADRLRRSPSEVARLLRVMTFAGTSPPITQGRSLSPREIVDVLLHGVQRPEPVRAVSPEREN